MIKDDIVVDKKEVKGTKKWVIALIVLFASIFTIAPIIIFFILIFNADYGIYNEFKENEQNEIMINKNAKIYDVEEYYDSENKTYYIQGYFENVSKDEIEYATIEYLVYDKEDVLLGTAVAYGDYIAGNSKWKFKATYSDIDSVDIVRYELKQVGLY